MKRERITLTSREVGAAEHIAPAVLESARIEALEDTITRGLLVKVSAAVLTDKLETVTHRRTVLTPTTWWQHLKDEHAPGWFKRRYPVQYAEHVLEAEFDVLAVFPDIQARYPRRGAYGRAFFQVDSHSVWRSE